MADNKHAFAHLAVHSHYTLLGGTASVGALVDRAVSDGFKALALTDTNVLYGAVAFHKACRQAGIQPIIGMTVTMEPPPSEIVLETAVSGALILLATGKTGYQSLCRLSSDIQTRDWRSDNQPPLLSWERLKQHTAGLICLSGGHAGWIERYVRAGRASAAARIASRLGGLFPESVFLSFSPSHTQNQVIQTCIQIGLRFGLRPAAVQPIFYLEPQDAPRLRLLSAIDHNCRLEDAPPATAVPQHWLDPDEITTLYADYPQAVSNVGEIVARCEPALPDGRPIWPKLDLPDNLSPNAALEAQAVAGLQAHYGSAAAPAINTRLAQELQAIQRHAFAPLFLVVADIARFARQMDIPINTRGSVANSLVAYCTGITNVDPIAHELLFERFLNPARASLPDIDLDFCSRRRDEILEYVRRQYGAERVALVATVSTLQPKSAVRETGKAYGLSEARIKKLAALWPRRWHPDPQRRKTENFAEILTALDDPLEKEVMAAAQQLIGQPHHLSIHPGGIVITPGPLTDVVPVQLAPKGFLITQFDYRDVEQIGLPKIDLLGIRALTVLADTAVAIRANLAPNFHLDHIPLDDELTGNMLSRGDTIGVFQCESSGAQRTLRQLKACTVRDLAVANAFFKPGPATGGMAKAFIRRYRGEEAVDFLHPALEPILQPTQGVLLFQEQVLRIAREIAGLSWAQADHLRRGMSKFQAAEMAAMARQFILGCQRPAPDGPGLAREQAQTLWEQIMAFAGYGFNQGHATAYADVSYRSAYLKAHFPAEFLCARLADYGGFHHPAIYMAEAQRLGIPVRPPHINHSGKRFTLTQELNTKHQKTPVLWMGLGQVRDLRRKAAGAIIAARREAPFSSLRDLLNRVALQPKEALHLIQCGALDRLGPSRAALLAEAEPIARAGNVRQLAFDFAVETAVSPETLAQCLEWEKHLLGQPVSVHPLNLVDNQANVVSVRNLPLHRSELVTVLGARLPGWTGGKGFFLGDGDAFVIVRQAQGINQESKNHIWQPLRVNGRWQVDEWGGGWFQASAIVPLPAAEAD